MIKALQSSVSISRGLAGERLPRLNGRQRTTPSQTPTSGTSARAPAAALIAAAERPARAGAVVSRGGRPDLAGPALGLMRAPTLLIVGGADEPVIEMNEDAKHMATIIRLEIVPGATHLFEEPGALEEVQRLSAEWFQRYLPHARGRGGPVDLLDGVGPGER